MRVDVLGLVPTPVDYQSGWDHQRAVHAEVLAGGEDRLLLLEHDPVYTAGKRTHPLERPTDGTPVVDVDRGGKITWHGPGQLVGYPIVRLPDPVDVVRYVRLLEQVLIDSCAEFGLATERVPGRSGVWVSGAPGSQARKVAAIGVRVAGGVTTHGFALNCDCDLSWYDRIVPCGISDASVSSISRELGRPVTVADALPVVQRNFETAWSAQSVRVPA
jgi:lipoyl(octanoyl) transferase